MSKEKKFIVICVVIVGILIMCCAIFSEELGIITHNSTSHHYNSDGNNKIDCKIVEMHNNDKYSEEKPHILDADIQDESDIEVAVNSFYYNGNKYICTGIYAQNAFIGDAVSIDEASKQEIYKIENIAEEYALAMESANKEKYYYYTNYDYECDSIKKFIEDTSFSTSTDNVSVRLNLVRDGSSTIVFYDGFANYLKDKMMKLADTEYIDNGNDSLYTGMTIAYYIAPINERIYMRFQENGDILVESLYSAKMFNFVIGKEGEVFALDLLEYLEDNGKAYKEYY